MSASAGAPARDLDHESQSSNPAHAAFLALYISQRDVSLVCEAAQELSELPANGGVVTPAVGILINILFDRYFLLGNEVPCTHSATLLDYTLWCCELKGGSAVNQSPYDVMFKVLSAVLRRYCSQCGTDPTAYALSFLSRLRLYWNIEKVARLEATVWSPMPWSVQSRAETSPPSALTALLSVSSSASTDIRGLSEAHGDACSVDFFQFPDMPWLGGTHDGYSHSPSLCAYVRARYKLGMSRREHLALWQSALSFGVLEIITQSHIPERWLVSSDAAGSPIFTSRHVSAILIHHMRRIYAASTAQQIAHANRATNTIIHALRALDEALARRRLTSPSDTGTAAIPGIFYRTGLADAEVDDIMCCLTSLSVILLEGFSLTDKGIVGRSPQVIHSPMLASMSVAEMLQQRMIAQGWCPSTAKRIKDTTLTLSGFAHRCKPYMPASSSAVGHSQCSKESCAAYNIDANRYVTQHLTPTCSCAFLVPPFADVSALLDAGESSREVPVMTYDGQKLAVRHARAGPYIAISHVWADGLGSTTEKGLPTCQVTRIAEYARQLVPDGAFWIDGLCVPELPRLRKRAIQLMAQTYRSAEAVVVFDNSIRTLCSADMPLGEQALRITTSAWMLRVWTLQEALLARMLYYEFSDGLYSNAELRHPCTDSDPISLCFRSILLCHIFFPLLRTSRLYDFSEITELLQYRTTSKPADETLAVAGVLGVSVPKLLAHKDAEARLRTLLLEVTRIPAAIIFGATPRMQTRGFRWAPRTLTSVGRLTLDCGYATCSPVDGLTSEAEFLVLSFPTIQPAELKIPAHPLPTIIDLPCHDSHYVLIIPEMEAEQELAPFNAIIAVPGSLDMLSGQQCLNANVLAVHISEHESQASSIVRCDYRFYGPQLMLKSAFTRSLWHTEDKMPSDMLAGRISGLGTVATARINIH